MLFSFAAGSAFAACETGRVDLRGEWGTARFSVEVADEADERSQGLMNRPSMPTSAGMLFVYERPQFVSFWMRNTLIPLDMLFIDQTGIVQRIHENAVPLDETAIPGGDGIQYVLEINGGLSSRLGIEVGSEVRHPSIGAAAWACE
ncbi:MAG: DUF192 domain-containing protein [Pseudomonadota bacterium]